MAKNLTPWERAQELVSAVEEHHSLWASLREDIQREATKAFAVALMDWKKDSRG